MIKIKNSFFTVFFNILLIQGLPLTKLTKSAQKEIGCNFFKIKYFKYNIEKTSGGHL